MKLLFKQNDIILYSYDLTQLDIDTIDFGSDNVKQLELDVLLKNSDQKKALQDLYNNIKPLKIKITDVYFYYNENIYYHYHSPIKTILYRVQSYIGNRQVSFREKLSIRFIEDNIHQPLFQGENEFIVCDKICPYRKDNYCKKYKEILDKYKQTSIICKSCFLDHHHSIEDQYYSLLFDNMNKKYKLIEEGERIHG